MSLALGAQGGESLTEAVGLFLAPFLHESLAFVGGAFLVQKGVLSAAACTLILLAGVIASDLALYGLGRLARRHRRVAALLPAGPRFTGTLDRHLAWLIPVSRLVPGLLFTVFTTCGLLGIGFRRFTLISVATAAVYTPLLLYGVIRLGDAIAARDRIGAWIAILAGLFALMTGIKWLVGRHLERRGSWPHPKAG
ncbi:MAG: hypothetical protein GC201_02970 [Alphaproteobacteria bacterium]|nr:hypothetical protein [Alphaproteobacteria bacterium]